MSKFQRRHYEAIAEVLGLMVDERIRNYCVAHFINMFERDNSRFQPDRFRGRVKQHADGIIMR